MKLHFKVDGGLHQSQYISIDTSNHCFTAIQYYPHALYMDLSQPDYDKLFRQCVESSAFSENWYL